MEVDLIIYINIDNPDIRMNRRAGVAKHVKEEMGYQSDSSDLEDKYNDGNLDLNCRRLGTN